MLHFLQFFSSDWSKYFDKSMNTEKPLLKFCILSFDTLEISYLTSAKRRTCFDLVLKQSAKSEVVT